MMPQNGVVRTAIKNGLLIFTWNHSLFGQASFPAPLLMSGVQFAFQNLLAKLVFKLGIIERHKREKMSWREWSRMVLPNGVTTGLDIGFSNKSLVYITMSFYTMCKSTVPMFLLFFAFIWKIEKPSWQLGVVVCVICSGLALLVDGETEFDITGFLLVMTASCLSGLRFVLTQVLLHGNPIAREQDKVAFGGPLDILETLTPVMAVTMLILSLAWEQLWVTLPTSPYFLTLAHTGITTLIILVGAVMAFLMVWTEYKVIKETSALTFMIAGTCKEVVTVIAAVLVMGDTFGPVNTVGLIIVIFGVVLFNWYKYQKIMHGEIPSNTPEPHDVRVRREAASGSGGSSPRSSSMEETPLLGGGEISATGGARSTSPTKAAASASDRSRLSAGGGSLPRVGRDASV
eukprot:gene15942-22074_t